MLKLILETIYNLVMLFYYIVEALVVKFIPIRFRSKDISGQIALVTGAGGGIGRLIALGLSKLGCIVVCWDVAKQANEETARLIKMSKGQVYAYQVDLTKREEIYRAADRLKQEVGKVSILVNNAGVVTGKALLECSDELIQRTFDVNILAHFWTVKSFLPDMIMQDQGHIVTIASLAGLSGCNRLVDYCASKFAAVGFDESLRTELAVDGRKGIKTTVVCPFFVKTPLFAGIESKILPVLEPETVASETIDAILTEQPVCLIPSRLSILLGLKSMLPIKALISTHKAFGLDETMNAFDGPKTKYN
ncbi:epidermal retinol dehydrogenase 2-like [Daphnia pulicaria]|uniref:epidermal retinol dehydrogenase 2-like n=1 Tax=Daphnia pulicaria TaxID=35523 RepID=UPI001EEA3A29|nr:epidermal retinol dehydrogenase 2-like [Daphnia pulicaria]